MSIALIRWFPDKVLRQVCRPVAIDDQATQRDVRDLVQMLKDTLFDARARKTGALGISAPQIGAWVRVFLVHVPQETSLPMVFVNPHVMQAASTQVEMEEGCLSLPGIYEKITRAHEVTCQRWDEYARTDTHTFKGMTARVILHEMDHLDGKLMFDHMLPARRRMAERQVTRRSTERTEHMAVLQRRSERHAARTARPAKLSVVQTPPEPTEDAA